MDSHIAHTKADARHRLIVEQRGQIVVATAAEERAVIVRVRVEYLKYEAGVVVKTAYDTGVPGYIVDTGIVNSPIIFRNFGGARQNAEIPASRTPARCSFTSNSSDVIFLGGREGNKIFCLSHPVKFCSAQIHSDYARLPTLMTKVTILSAERYHHAVGDANNLCVRIGRM